MRHLLLLWLALFVIGCGSSVQVPPAVLAPFSDPIVQQPPTQSPPPVIVPPAEAQRFQLSAISAPVAHNLVQATGPLGGSTTADVLSFIVSAGTVTMSTHTGIASDCNPCAGVNVTISHFAPAFPGNDGTYPLLTADNGSQTYPTYTFSCSSCTTWEDYCCGATNNTSGTLKAMTYSAFPTMVKDSSSVLHAIFYLGCAHTNCPASSVTYPNAQTGGSVVELTSSDASTGSTSATKIFWDAGTHCLGNTIPCDWENGATGVTAAAVPFAWAMEQDWGGSGNLGNFFKTYENGAWSSATELAGTSPAGNAWNISFGNCAVLDGTPYCTFVDTANKVYLTPFCGDGTTACGKGPIHLTAPGYTEMPTNECAPYSVDGALKAIVFCRTNKLVAGNCASAPCVNLLMLTTSDLATFTAYLSPLPTVITGTTVELVAPSIYSTPSNQAMLVYGERDATQSEIMAVAFDPSTLFNDYTAIAFPQDAYTISFANSDATYPAFGCIGTACALAWHRVTNNSQAGMGKIFTQSATFSASGSMAVNGVLH